MHESVVEKLNYSIVLSNQEKFDFGQVDKYKADFLKYTESGFCLSNFEDNKWKFNDENRYMYFNFELTNKEQLIMIKCFAISLLNTGLSLMSIRRYLYLIPLTIKLTNFYSKEKIEEFEEWLVNTQTPYHLQEIPIVHKAFFEFYDVANHDKYTKLFNNVYRESRNVRELPPYKDILYFDKCLIDFEQNSTGTLRKKYLPLFIWWKLTKIIPMRTKELVSIKKSDIKDTKNGTILVLNRIKATSRYAVPIQTTFSIGDDVAKLIHEYLEVHNDITPPQDVTEEEKKYLFPHYVHSEQKSPRNKKISRKIKTDILKHVSGTIINTLLDEFYEEIILKKYGLNLTQMNIMDTRHLAICGLKMQGFSPLTIARLAGHRDLKAQNHYLSHIEVFNEAATNVLAESIARETLFNVDKQVLPKQIQHNILKSNLINTESVTHKEIENGYCTDDNFPANCQMACESCPFFIFSPKKQAQKLVLAKYSDKLAEQKANAITLFKVIHDSLISRTSPNEVLEDTELLNAYKSHSEVIKRIVEQHAIVKAKILLEDNQQWLDHKNTLTSSLKNE